LVVADEDLDGMLEEFKSEMSPEVLKLLADLKNMDKLAIDPLPDTDDQSIAEPAVGEPSGASK